MIQGEQIDSSVSNLSSTIGEGSNEHQASQALSPNVVHPVIYVESEGESSTLNDGDPPIPASAAVVFFATVGEETDDRISYGSTISPECDSELDAVSNLDAQFEAEMEAIQATERRDAELLAADAVELRAIALRAADLRAAALRAADLRAAQAAALRAAALRAADLRAAQAAAELRFEKEQRHLVMEMRSLMHKQLLNKFKIDKQKKQCRNRCARRRLNQGDLSSGQGLRARINTSTENEHQSNHSGDENIGRNNAAAVGDQNVNASNESDEVSSVQQAGDSSSTRANNSQPSATDEEQKTN